MKQNVKSIVSNRVVRASLLIVVGIILAFTKASQEGPLALFSVLCILVGIIWLVTMTLSKKIKPSKFCCTCGFIAIPKNNGTRGSIWTELLLWCLFIVPGLIYSVWRLAGKPEIVCIKCGSNNLVPLDSPIAQKFDVDYRNVL